MAIFKLVLVIITTLFLSTTASAALVTFELDLQGSQEVGVGDTDGYGFASLIINDQTLTVDWDFDVFNIGNITGAHIHQAPLGTNGGVVVDFSGQLSGAGLFDGDLANLLLNPTNYYVNVHTSEFPRGAIRGQLGAPSPVPVPAAIYFFGSALLGLVALRRRKNHD